MNTLNALHPGALPSFNSIATAAFLPLLVMIGGFLFARTWRRVSQNRHLASTFSTSEYREFFSSHSPFCSWHWRGFWPCQTLKRKTNPNPRTNGAARVSRQCTTAKSTSWDWLPAGISLTKGRISCTRKLVESSHTHGQRLTTARRR